MTFHNIVSLEGKTALVVGGGGLGTPIAQAFLENGAEVIIADIRNSISEELRKTAAIAGKEVRFVPVDLLSEESIVAAVEEAKQVTGRIDILVNAAGINKLERAEEYQTASWDDVLGINLRGLFLTTREVDHRDRPGLHRVLREQGRREHVHEADRLRVGEIRHYRQCDRADLYENADQRFPAGRPRLLSETRGQDPTRQDLFGEGYRKRSAVSVQ